MNFPQYILVWALRLYRAAISPVLTGLFGPMGWGCRFQPTCSQYALEAITRLGALRGTALSLRRLCRCHPWGGCGEDPVPTNIPASLLTRGNSTPFHPPHGS